MLYLEDYLELIEHLPQELRDRFTDIRERDLQVHNSTEQLKEKSKQFFAEAKKCKTEQIQCDYDKLLNEYQDTMKYADDKVHIAKQMHDIMIKLVQRLDTELEKFKLELEADHAGITEELEKRSLELDADSRLDDLINNHLNGIPATSATTTTTTTIPITPITTNNNTTFKTTTTTSTTKVPSEIKDRRRSEHKHRHHPYQNNQDNGYHGRAKLSHHEHSNTPKNSLHNHPHHTPQGSKSTNNAASCRLQAASSSSISVGGYSSVSAPASVAGDLNGTEPTAGHYGNNLSSFGNNLGFKNSSSNKNNPQNATVNINAPFKQHSALSAALASNTPQLNSISALAMMNATSVHNKISTNLKGNDLTDPNSPLVRQNPIAAAASQAIAATQQVKIYNYCSMF